MSSPPVTTWTNIRAFAAQTGEAVAMPVATSMVSLLNSPLKGNIPRLVEFRFDSIALGGTVNATAVLIDIYRVVAGLVDWVATWTIAATDITNGRVGVPIYEAYSDSLYCKVSFAGGTAPTVTGTVMARAVE